MRVTISILALLAACATPRSAGVEANERLAEAATQRGDWLVAVDLWHRVYLADQLENSRACLETSRALFRLGDLESAEALLRDGARRFPDDSAVHELRGVVLEESGYRRAAEAAYARAVDLQPGLVRALEGLGRVRLHLGLESSAIPPLRRLVELKPEPEALRLLARAALAAREHVIAYDTFLHLFDDTEGTLEDLMDAAVLGLEPALGSARRASPLVCEAWLVRALELDPQQTHAHILLGAYRELAGDDVAAMSHLTRALETDPASVEALLELAEIQIKFLLVEEAEALLEQASQLAEDDSSRARVATLLLRTEGLRPKGD